MRYTYLSILSLFITFWICIAAETSIVKRGTATMMSFDQDNHSLFTKRNRGTWYSGKGLKDAACYDRKDLPAYSARVSDMIGAMAMEHFEYCYKCMHITNIKNNHSIVVKIVDKCAGCKTGEAIDLTPAAFEKLNPEGLEIGVLNIKWTTVPCPASIHLHFEPKKSSS